uniref:FLYWCH-type domain-containing protein n=1 Tax=Steinernema glaseri TaxID=37863 RepID=A0A1I8A6C1_9BILA
RTPTATFPLNLSVIRFQEKLSKSNSRLLSHNGYDYRFDKAHTGGPFESWRCVRGRSCPGRIKVKAHSCEGTITNERHAHEPEEVASYKQSFSSPPTMVPPPLESFSFCWPHNFINLMSPMLNQSHPQQPQLSYPQVQYPQSQQEQKQQSVEMSPMQPALEMPPSYDAAVQQSPSLPSPGEERRRKRKCEMPVKVAPL